MLFRSRYIALKALDGAVKSEFLVTAASVQDYDRQVEEIVPALLWNLVETDVVELRNQCVRSLFPHSCSALIDTSQARQHPVVKNRPPAIVPLPLVSQIFLNLLADIKSLRIDTLLRRPSFSPPPLSTRTFASRPHLHPLRPHHLP